MNWRRLLARLSRNPNNVAYDDFVDLIIGFGFVPRRTRGSHQTFEHPSVAGIVNVQPAHGEAKPYQVRQFLRLVERHNLRLED